MRSFNLIISIISLFHALSSLQSLDLQHLTKRSFLPALKDAQTIAESSKTAAATASASKQLLSLEEHSPVHQADVLSSLHHEPVEQKNLPPINKQQHHDASLVDHPITPSDSPKPNLQKEPTQFLPPIDQHISETSHDNSLTGHIPTNPSSPSIPNLEKQPTSNEHPQISPASHDPSSSKPPKLNLEKESSEDSPTTQKHSEISPAHSSASHDPSSPKPPKLNLEKESSEFEHSEISPAHSPGSHPSTPSTPGKPNLEEQQSGQPSKGRLSALRKYSSDFLKKATHKLSSVSADTRKAVKLWLRSWKDRLCKWFNQVFKKGRPRATEPTNIPKLQRQPKVRPGQLEPIFFDGKVFIPSRPPSEAQFQEYRESRALLAQAMAQKLKRPYDGMVWDPQSLAELIARRMAPPGDKKTAEYQEAFKRSILVHQTYLENVMKQQKIVNSLKPLQDEWTNIQTSITLHTLDSLRPLNTIEHQAMQEVIDVLDNFDRDEFRAKFTQEFQGLMVRIESKARFRGDEEPPPPPPPFETRKQRAERIKNEIAERNKLHPKWELTHPDLRRYFPNMAHTQRTDRYYKLLAKARAIQMTRDPSEAIHIPLGGFSSVEEVIRTLPKELDLIEEIYRFIVVTGLENILKAIRPQVTNFVKTLVEDRLADIFPTLKDIESVFESTLRSTEEEDLAWRESLFTRFSPVEMSPEAVYEKLLQVPNSPAQIRYVLNNPSGPATFLSKEDLDALKEAASTRRTFKAKLSEIEERIPEALENKQKTWNKNLVNHPFFKEFKQHKFTQMRAAMESLKKESLGRGSVNLPFIEELYEKGVIDASTRTRLDEAAKVSKEELKNALGPESEFKKLLLDKHAAALLQHFIAPESQQMEVVYKATESLTNFFLSELDQKAKSFYLTRDAFLKPDSFRETEAWNVYEQDAIRKLIQSPSGSKQIIKAFAEANLASPTRQLPKSEMEQLLNEIRVPQVSKENVLSSEFPNFDERLYGLFHRPLERGDSRLKGTSFETLSPETRDKLNEVVEEFYVRRETLEAKALKIKILGARIEQTEKTQLAPEIPYLSRILRSILWPGIEL
ncbi:hypothetical protein PGT21_012255 [Puccinia graminis f. sp. tritici]|uniref:Uncharacterized protein n=1 Tax=Puccinia graminis f. sp. tritici TaxID=56615 RepID=A0A5B0NME9_PUCGR|nr:hypothetical protein PGT21_012255 [Puccinia graminis f. sp. tritici]KAA1089963.1 hypothetical protein PGTUg99_031603 [Puccinia graminis f. sp. tritici]